MNISRVTLLFNIHSGICLRMKGDVNQVGHQDSSGQAIHPIQRTCWGTWYLLTLPSPGFLGDSVVWGPAAPASPGILLETRMCGLPPQCLGWGPSSLEGSAVRGHWWSRHPMSSGAARLGLNLAESLTNWLLSKFPLPRIGWELETGGENL